MRLQIEIADLKEIIGVKDSLLLEMNCLYSFKMTSWLIFRQPYCFWGKLWGVPVRRTSWLASAVDQL